MNHSHRPRKTLTDVGINLYNDIYFLSFTITKTNIT